MGSVVDYTEKYSNDSEALDRWIADCFMDPQPCKPMSAVAPAGENEVVIPLDDVIIPRRKEKLNSRSVYERKVVEFDPVSALEETQRFVAKLLGTQNTKKKIYVSHSGVGYGVTKPEFVSKSLNPKRKFDDSDGEDVKDVKKQKTIPGIVHQRPEQQKCMAKLIGKPSLRKQYLGTGTHNKYKFQPLVC